MEEVDHFTYLGSVVDTQRGTEADVKVGIGKARVVFLQLKNIWKSNVLSLKNKIGISNTKYVKAVLLYGAGTWRTTMTTTKRIQTFGNSCPRRILGICWSKIICDEQLWRPTSQIDGLVIRSANQPTALPDKL